MQAELYANAASTTLNGGINNSVTTLTVTSASGFPTGTGQFRIIIDSEIMIVTGVSGTTFTITRGAENTTAASHSNGAGVVHNVTSDSLQRTAEANFWQGTRAIGKAKTVKTENTLFTGGQLQNLCNLSGLGPGYISSMFFYVNGTTAAGRENTLMTLYRDGNVTADVSLPLAQLHAGFYGPGSFNSQWIGWANPSGYMNRFLVPFTDGFKIDITNGDGSTSMHLYAVIEYVLTPNAFKWGRMARFKAYGQNLSNITKHSPVTLINIAGRGVLFGLYQVFHDGNDTNLHFAEGNHQFYIDSEGSNSLEWTGTDHYFENPGYWNSGVQIGPHTGTVVKSGTTDVGSYRFHNLDPIVFDTNLQIVWNCGDAGATNTMASNLANMIYTCYYYLDQ